MNEFNKKYLEEWKSFDRLYAEFRTVFSSGSSESRVATIKSDFLKNFNAVASYLLKSSKKIEVCKRRYGGIFVGGQYGISNQSYASQGGVEFNDLLLFFTQLDKVDEKLKADLGSKLYDKWVSFLMVFEGGVDKILFGQNQVSDAGQIDINEKVVLRKALWQKVKDDSDDDEGSNDDDLREAILKSVKFNPKEDGSLECDFVFRGGTLALSDFDKVDLFFMRDYLDRILIAEQNFREKEVEVVNAVKEQYSLFEEKATPFLSLKEL